MSKKYLLVSILIVLSFGILAGNASAGTAVVSWNANTEPDLASYKIYYGTSLRTGSDPKVCGTCGYSNSINIGNVTSYTFNNLTDGQTYYFSVSAIDTSANESSFSSEVSKVIPAAVDTTPPTRSSGSPSGQLSANTTQTTISLTTNENATCKYSTTSGTAYLSITNTFSITGTTSHSTSVSGLQNGQSYNYYVKCQDMANNSNTDDYTISFSVAMPADTTPPTISSVTSSSITNNSATITWTTNENSDSQVEYGPNTAYGSQTTLNVSTVNAHSVLLSGLNQSTIYHYRVKSKDAASNLATSSDYSFTTPAALSLSVSLTASPLSGTAPLSGVDLTAIVSGTVTGNINYTFYCNRSDTGLNVISGYNAKYDNLTQTSRTGTDICNYSSAGTYIAKVIVERGSYQAEARITITVSAVTAPTTPTVPTTPTTPTTPPSGSASLANLLRASSDTKVYEVVNNLIHWIPNPIVFNAYGFSWSNIRVVSNEEVNKYFRAKLLRAQGDVKVYYLTEAGQIRHIPNPEIFNSYNNKWEEILTVSPTEISSYSLSNLIRLENGTKVYKLENNTKRWIETAEVFNRLKYDWTKIAPVNQTELNYYPEGTTIK